jgi:hypothetical protein
VFPVNLWKDCTAMTKRAKATAMMTVARHEEIIGWIEFHAEARRNQNRLVHFISACVIGYLFYILP